MEEILAMEHITKTYPGVKALDDVSISFIQGEVHAVMGENGAGKSTLMKILNGMIQADSGDIRFHGEKVAIRNPRDARALGIAMIHQELNPIKDLTVAENMFVGRYPQKGCFVDWSTMYDECRKLFEHWKVDFDPTMICLGLIGLGQAAQILHIPNIEKMENKFEITAVADISKNLTNYIADKYRVPHRFTDGMDLIGCPDVDAVMVMSPGDHAEFAIAALEAGKHVFIEKPMTSSLESLEKLLEVKRRHPDQIAMVGYCRRYNDSFMKMKELLQADSRPISYVRARTIILEGPWYLDNTWHEHKADDLDPAGRELMNRRMFEEIDRVLGGNTSHAQQMAYLLMTASGCHILSAIRELIGLPKAIRSAVVSPNGMQFSLVFEYDNFNMVFEEMNDQEIVEFDEAIEIYQGDRKMLLEYDTPYIRYLPSKVIIFIFFSRYSAHFLFLLDSILWLTPITGAVFFAWYYRSTQTVRINTAISSEISFKYFF